MAKNKGAAGTHGADREAKATLASARKATTARHAAESARSKPEPPAATSAQDHLDPMEVLAALKALKRGDFRIRLPITERVVDAAISEAFNEVAELLESHTRE